MITSIETALRQMVNNMPELSVLSVDMKLSTTLSRLLKERQMTATELAEAIQVKRTTLNGWRKGVTPRDLSEVHRCAKFFGISLEQLLFDEAPDIAALEGLLTERVFDGFLKVKIERVISKKS